MLVGHTDASQGSGCVLSPFVYALYTNESHSVDPSTMFVRFSVYTAILAVLCNFASYQSGINVESVLFCCCYMFAFH